MAFTKVILTKVQIPLGEWSYPYLHKVCFAAMEFVLFGAFPLRDAPFLFFILEEKKMNKLLGLILSVVMTFSCVACSAPPPDWNDGNTLDTDGNVQTDRIEDEKNDGENKTNPSKSDAEKLSGTIVATAGFSEGLSLVNIQEDTGRTYCIDTDFNIVFVLDVYVDEFNLSTFTGGLVRISETALCDRKGKITTAEELGVTSFPSRIAISYHGAIYDELDVWRKDGYIIAESIEATYASSSKKIGVLNSNFEWVIEPCEEMYELFEVKAINAEYIKDGYFHVDLRNEGGSYVNIKTLAVTEELPFALPSNKWSWNGQHFENYEGEIMLDLTGIANILDVSEFQDGVCVVTYYNQSAQKQFFNLINEKGEFVFDPTEIPLRSGYYGRTDEAIVIAEGNKVYSTYDKKGNFLGRLSFSDLSGDKLGYSIAHIGNDVIVVRGGLVTMYDRKIKYRFYNNRFEQIH